MKNKLKFTIISIVFILLSSIQASATLMEQILEKEIYIDLKISPDGNHFAMSFRAEGKRNLSIFNISTKTMTPISGVSLGNNLHVGEFYWANNERIIYQVLKKVSWSNAPQFYGEMFGINIDGSSHDVIFGYRVGNNAGTSGASRIKKKESTWAHFDIVNLIPEEKDFVIIESTPFGQKGVLSTILKLNIVNGKKEKIAKLPLPRANAVTDYEGNLKFSYGTNHDGKIKLYKREKNKWKVVLEYFGNKGGALPISISDKSIYMIDNTDDNFEGLYRINIENNNKELVYRNEITDISQVYINPQTKHPYLVITDPDKEKYHYIEESGKLASTHKKLSTAFKGNMVKILSLTKDLNKMIIKVSSDKVVGDFYLFDRVKQNASFIASQKPQLDSKKLASTQPISYENRNGQIIHGYFTTATGLSDNEIAPLVIMPHGGPHGVRDYWEFDSQVQVFATNGISVLQVNYTGSSGYGKKFEYDGYRQWGDLIQNDITDGTKWAIEKGMVEKDEICIYGFSFGGYAALMAVIREPDLYQCAAGGGGVYDLGLMYKADDINQLLWGKEYLESAIGKDKEELKRNSPTYNTDKIKVPVFIAHGKNDTRVPPKQAKNLVKMLKKSGVDHEVVYFSKEGHGFADLDNRVKFNNKLLKFLKKHLTK